MPPARASGDIRKKGTAVVTTLIGSTDGCAVTIPENTHKSRMAVSFKAVVLIS
jgi:hypothetical protein